MNEKVKRLAKLALIAVPVLIIAFLVVLALRTLVPGLIPVIKSGDEAMIEEYIRGFGDLEGVAITAFLQFFQVVSIILPGMPIQIAAGVVLGAFKGFVVCHLAYVAANLVVFLLARKLRGRLGKPFDSEKDGSKLGFVSDSEYPEYTVVLACLMPFLPNGAVPYLAARSRLTAVRFTLAVAGGSFPAILLFCTLGHNILKGNYAEVIVISVVMIIAIALLYIFRERVMELIKRLMRKIKRKK